MKKLVSFLILGLLVNVANAQESSSEQKNRQNIQPKDVWGDSANELEKLVKTKQRNLSNMRLALDIIDENIFSISDHFIEFDKIFIKLRELFTLAEFSNEELFSFIDDAFEIRNKYYIIQEFVVRLEYARRSIQYGISKSQAIALTSSEYMQIPAFALNENVDVIKLNSVLIDIGCGIVWKDRLKFLFANNRCFGHLNDIQIRNFARFPKNIKNYIILLRENYQFVSSTQKHLAYLIAQNFQQAGISKDIILKIFQLTEKEWKEFFLPVKN